MRITKLETIIVKPRWVFLKIHTDEGVVGLGELIIDPPLTPSQPPSLT